MRKHVHFGLKRAVYFVKYGFDKGKIDSRQTDRQTDRQTSRQTISTKESKYYNYVIKMRKNRNLLPGQGFWPPDQPTDRPTDQPTDPHTNQPTDQRTDTASYDAFEMRR